MEMCRTTQTDLALAFWPLSADIHTCVCVSCILAAATIRAQHLLHSELLIACGATIWGCVWSIWWNIHAKLALALFPGVRKIGESAWYTLFTYPLGKTFYRVSTVWLGWMLLLSCNSLPLRVMTLVLQWYMIVQHGDVYSSFQVPQKTWGAAHAWTVCTRHSTLIFRAPGNEIGMNDIENILLFTMYKNYPFSFPPAMCN